MALMRRYLLWKDYLHFHLEVDSVSLVSIVINIKIILFTSRTFLFSLKPLFNILVTSIRHCAMCYVEKFFFKSHFVEMLETCAHFRVVLANYKCIKIYSEVKKNLDYSPPLWGWKPAKRVPLLYFRSFVILEMHSSLIIIIIIHFIYGALFRLLRDTLHMLKWS